MITIFVDKEEATEFWKLEDMKGVAKVVSSIIQTAILTGIHGHINIGFKDTGKRLVSFKMRTRRNIIRKE